MRQRIKKLLNAVERLGLDTQPIRDLLSAEDVDLEDYKNRVVNLEREIPKHPAGSQPQQVQILVKHLKPRPKEATFKTQKINLTAENYIVQKHESTTDPNLMGAIEALAQQLATQQAPSPATPASGSGEVLDAIKALNDKVDKIKFKGGVEVEIDPHAPKMKEGFVNPLDEEEVSKLKGEVHVVPKKGKPITSSLKKLRDLKK